MYQLNIVNLYLSWTCNHKCIHCWVEGSSEKNQQLDLDTCLKFLNDSLQLGLKTVKITGGEPLVFIDIVKSIINWCDINNISVAIESNGSLLTEDFIKNYLVNKNVDLSISLNGFNNETHDYFVQNIGSFDKVTNNLLLLKKYKISYLIITSLYKNNKDDLEKVISLSSKLGAREVKINPIVSIGRGEYLLKENKVLNSNELKELVPIVDGYSKKYSIPIFLHVPPSIRSFSSLKCYGINVCAYKNMISLLPDKSISLCGYGGVNPEAVWGVYSSEFDLKDFWNNNDKIKILRAIDKTKGICSNCVHESLCHGDCKAASMNKYCSWDSPNPICQDLADKGLFPRSRMVYEKR